MYKFGIGSGSENRNDFEFICKLMNEKDEKNENILSLDEALWLQAYEGFLTLKSLAHNRALSILQYIFEHVLQGKEIEEDGKTKFRIGDKEYCSLKDEELIDKMVKELRKLYKKAGFSKEEIPVGHSLKRSLKVMNMERETLIKLGFAITFALNKEERFEKFNDFLQKKAGERRLSTAVPEELILIYSLKQGKSWRYFRELRNFGTNRYFFNFIVNQNNDNMEEPPLTDDETVEMGLDELILAKQQPDERDKRFITEYLSPCYERAGQKTVNKRQYSAKAWNYVRENSILQENETNPAYFEPSYEGIYSSNTLKKYSDLFNLCDYGFSKEVYTPHSDCRQKILSVDEYGRFFSYRIRKQNYINDANSGVHDNGLFSMKYGELSQDIALSVFHVGILNKLKDRTSREWNRKKGNRDRIKRHVVLGVAFSNLLIEHWKNKENPIVEYNWKKIIELWKKFFISANKILSEVGYSGLNNHKPYDALLELCFHSLCPLEIYTRIYELNVISSYINDPNANERDYPSKDRMCRVLDTLNKIYDKLGSEFEDSKKELKVWREGASGKLF